MADDVLVDNAGLTDYTVAADDASGALVQLVKLAYSADGSRTAIEADASGLQVDVTRVGHPLGSAQSVSWTSATAGDSVLTVNTTGYLGAVLSFRSDGGTVTGGVIRFEGSVDGGTEYQPISAIDMSAQNYDYPMRPTVVSDMQLPKYRQGGNFDNTLFAIPGNGCTHIRIRLFATFSGTQTIALDLYPSNAITETLASAAADFTYAIAKSGAAVSGWGQYLNVGGADAGDVNRLLKLTTSGALIVGQGDTIHDAAASTVNPLPIGGYASTAAPSNVSADFDMVRAWFLRNGAQAVNLTAAGALIGGDAINGLQVDVTRLPAITGAVTANAGTNLNTSALAVESGGNLAAVRTAVELIDDAIVGSAMQVSVVNPLGGGTEATAVRVTIASDSTGVVSVDDNGASLTVDGTVTLGGNDGVDIGDVTINNASGASAVNIQDGGNSITVDGSVGVSGTVTASNTAGDVAHDAADSGNPVKVGFKAASAFPTAVANTDRANAVSDLFGRQLVAHIDCNMQVWKSANYTSTQTGTTIWDPTAGKRISITSIVIGSYGTTAGRLILWFGANGDTTYSAGTDQLVLAASYAPSTNSKPGTVFTPAVPVCCMTADYELHITTDAALSVDITVYGYEW